MSRNIIALYLVKLSKWFSLVMPIIVLFYEEHGLGLHDVFVLKSVYSITAVALEIPSGYLADVWGRKRCLLLGCLLVFGGCVCYACIATFYAFLCAELLLGIGQTLVNGADSALLYDTLLHHKREDRYFRYEGRMTMEEMVRIVRYSLFTNRELCSNIMYSGIIGAATLTMAWFVQPVLIHLDTPTKWFGVIWTVLNLTVGIAALGSDRVERKLGMNRMNALILVMIIGGYVALAYNLTWAGLAVLFLFYIFRGLATPILKGYINQLTFSEMRATVLSIRNFVIRLMFAGVAPFVGWLNDMYSLQTALLASAALFFLPGLFFLLWGYRK